MNRHNLIRSGALAGIVMLTLVACDGDDSDQAQPNPAPATSSTTATTPTTDPSKPASDVFTLLSLDSGDAACYLNVQDASGAEQALPADFELCPGGGADATGLVGKQITLERRPSDIMADSCAGDPACTDTKTVNVVFAVTPAAPS